jgi:hypothetical protein
VTICDLTVYVAIAALIWAAALETRRRALVKQADALQAALVDCREQKAELVQRLEQEAQLGRAARDEAQLVQRDYASYTEQLAEASQLLGAARAETEQAAALAVREKNRADRQFGVIGDIERERDQVWQRYRDLCVGAGNAQDLLFRELDRVLRLYNARAKEHGFETLRHRKDLQEALDAFAAEHRQSDEHTRRCVREMLGAEAAGAEDSPDDAPG